MESDIRLRIPIKDNYFLKSDKLNIMLVEEKTSQGEKTAGATKDDIIGYYQSVENALDGFKKHMVLRSEAKSILELREDLRKIDETIKNLLKTESKNG